MSDSPCGSSVLHRMAVSDSSQLIKRGTTSLASSERLLRDGAVLVSWQDRRLCSWMDHSQLSVPQANPSPMC